MKNNKGFSLVELIVVIAIMAILAAVAIPTFATFITKANVASDEQFIADLSYAIELANTTSGKTVSEPTVTASEGVISKVEYTVGDATVTINVANGVATVDSAVTDEDLVKAANDAIATMEWTYEFKSSDYATGYSPAAANTETTEEVTTAAPADQT